MPWVGKSMDRKAALRRQQDLFATTPGGIRREARFSPCMKWRYWLLRQWDASKPMGVVLGINPSKAGAEDEDQTTRKLIGFGKVWGWGGYYLGNPFALVSTDQRGLLTAADPIGPENDAELERLFGLAPQIVCAWGSAKTSAVRRLLDTRLVTLAPLLQTRELLCLGRTKDGSPQHPLMLAYSTPLEPWRQDRCVGSTRQSLGQ